MTHARAPATRRRTAPGAATSTATAASRRPSTPAPGGPRVAMPQAKMRVSTPGEPMEREADVVAERVVSPGVGGPVALTTPDGASAQRALQLAADQEVQRAPDEEVQRAADEEVQRADGGGAPRVTPRTARTINQPGSGAAMPRSVRGPIESHLGADLGGVRVHTGAAAAHAATSVGARAFTVGNDIFLNRGESPIDARLMAHESTHVVQQGAAGARPVAARSTDEIQRLPDFVTDELADWAHDVPGYTLFTVIIAYDPLRGEHVERTALNLVHGLMGLVPGGNYIFNELTRLDILQPAFEFIEQQLARFDLSLARLERTIEAAWDDMDFIRLDPFAYNFRVLSRHAGELLDDVIGFAGSVVGRVMELIKEALIGVAEDLLAENRAWDLIKKILHHDPLRGEDVDAPTVEILEDFLLLIGRQAELEQMKARGTLQKTADWLDTQVSTFFDLITEFGSLFTAAWDAIQPENLVDLPTNLAALVQRVWGFLQRVWDFASTVAAEVIQLIKDALLGWLASFVDEVPGFHLLTVILGRNPFTGEVVPRTAVNIIRGFITLLPGGSAIYAKLAETGVIAEAGARIEGAIAELGISWEFIVGLFTGIWDTIVTIDTLIDPIGVFTQIRDQFGEPVSRLFRFIRVVLSVMLELILAMMSFPTELIGRIITNAMQAYEQIKQDPVLFLLNMLEAVKRGFSNFFDNVLDHLVGGLVDWLFRGLRDAGIEPPEDLSFGSILDTVLQVLGITMDRIWEKLAQRFGQETIDRIRGAIDMVSGVWTLVKDVSERGISALWEYLTDQLSNLWNTVLQAATDWIMEQIIGRVVAKLLSMLDPTGIMAVVNGFIAFFNAIQSAIEYLRDILEIVDDWVSTIAAVAAGDVEPGAAKLEGGLAAAIPVAIGFLANQVGLGNISEKIAEIIGRVRETVDAALDWLLDKLEAGVQRVLAMIAGGGDEPVDEEAAATDEAGVDATDHTAFARHAVRRLQQDAGEATDLSQLRAAAEGLEPGLTAQLEPGIALRYTFVGGPQDAEDGSVRVKVTIAPNTTEVDGEVELGDCTGPGTSAEGIGQTQPHAAKPSSNRSGQPIHHTESEHIIPYAIGDALLETLGITQGSRSASRKFDGALTTVMIYKGAANEKTRGDQSADSSQIRRFKDQMRGADVPRRLERGEHFAQAGGGVSGDSADAFASIVAAIEAYKTDAISRTQTAVENEWKSKTEGCERTNGQRRSEPDPIPASGVIASTGEQQRNQIYHYARHLYNARGERPISAPDSVPAAVDRIPLADLNDMTEQGEFMLIRGVGPALGSALASARAAGPFDRSSLAAVPGIGPAFMSRIL